MNYVEIARKVELLLTYEEIISPTHGWWLCPLLVCHSRQEWLFSRY